jgi:hypothetical protein
MRFNEASDTHLEWAYGDGRLWLYDVSVLGGRAARPRAEIVEISLASGRVVRAVAMPRLTRPFLAADDDGLWIAPSPETGKPGPAPTYLLTPNATALRIVRRGGDAAVWLLAARHTVWEDLETFRRGAANTRQELWRLDGPEGTARKLARLDNLNGNQPALQPTTDTLWTLNSVPDSNRFTTCTRQQVVAINGSSGRQTIVRTLRIPADPCFPIPPEQPFGGTDEGQLFIDGAFYFLSSPSLATTLYRVRR